MKIEVWSDFACPFCYIGETAMYKALENLELLGSAEVVFKSYQLDENAKRQPEKDIHQIIAEKYGISYEKAKESNAQIVDMAKAIGLTFDFDNLKRGNTRKAHELFKLAEKLGKSKQVVDGLFKAYFEEGRDIGDIDELCKLGEDIGLDGNSVLKALESGNYYEAVITDQATAFQMRIQSVPCFIIDEKYLIQGAQATGYFEKAFSEINDAKLKDKSPIVTIQ